LKGFYHVYRVLGFGFNEKVYENALLLTLRKWGLKVQPQVAITVYFEGETVWRLLRRSHRGRQVLIELKAVEHLIPAHEAQLLNYLKATNIEVGLLLNFGPKAEFRRRVFSNERKGPRSA
jgi:GxxExxY protein